MASATPPAGGSQGTGQDLSTGNAVPVELRAPRARRGRGWLVTRLRVRFSKFGKVRFTYHRDVARIWERSLRRGDVAVAYTEGFSPRPKLSFGLALSTGYESYGEYLDVVLREGSPVGIDDIGVLVTPGLPARHRGAGRHRAGARAPSRCSRRSPAAPGTSTCGGVTPSDAAEALDGGAGGRPAHRHPRTQGSQRHRRRPARHPLGRVVGSLPSATTAAGPA